MHVQSYAGVALKLGRASPRESRTKLAINMESRNRPKKHPPSWRPQVPQKLALSPTCLTQALLSKKEDSDWQRARASDGRRQDSLDAVVALGRQLPLLSLTHSTWSLLSELHPEVFTH